MEQQNKEIVRLVSLIPYGRENAIKRSDLVKAFGESDRSVRRKINDARDYGYLILNEDDGRGYYVSYDSADLMFFYRKEMARAKAITDSLKPLKRELKRRRLL